VPRRLLALVALTALASMPARALTLPVVTRDLPNGLRILVHEDHSAPVVSSYIFFRAGSRNEQRGQTGIAHLFEHMMFNGGKKFGPGLFDDTIESAGGSTNGYTTRDFTAYLNNFPREALPVVLDLESDRMGALAITEKNLEQERGIVMEERRLRVDNSVRGTMWEDLYLHAFVQSPYRWNPVGFMADLEHITLADAQAFFTTYYAPNNAVMVLAGDVEAEAAFELVAQYFGRIPPQEPPAKVLAAEPAQDGERRISVRKRAELPAVLMAYHGVAATDPERAVFDVVAQLLAGGDSSRLSLDLVRAHEVATVVSSDLQWGIDPELFVIYAQARPGRTVEEITARVDAVLAALADEHVAPDELHKAKRQLRADYVRGLKRAGGKADQLGFAEVVLGGYAKLFGLPAQWDAVDVASVRKVIGQYLTPPKRTLVVLDPLGQEPAPEPAAEVAP
jgi:predicted Zn-dependent peptidase